MSVPVLSVQITWAEPRVSTAGKVLTIVFFFDIACIPMASTIVTIAGSPSGMAATARLIEVINISKGAYFLTIPIMNISAHIPTADIPSIFPVLSSLFCSGVSFFSPPAIIAAIFPTSVSIPVDVTIARPFP